MFYERLNTTALTNEDADVYFAGRIIGDEFNSDRTFLATLRALLPSRMQDGETFNLCIFHDDSASLIETYVKSSCIDAENRLFVVSYDTRDKAEAAEKVTEIAGFLNENGFKEAEKVSIFFKTVMTVKAMINAEKKVTVLLTERQDLCKHHLLQSCIPAILPWFFKKGEDGNIVSAEEKALLKTLSKPSVSDYRAYIREFAQKYDMKEVILRARLSGVETAFRDAQIRNLESSIRAIEDKIKELQSRIRDRLRERDDSIVKLYGMEVMKEKEAGNDEILEYFLSNEHIALDSVDGSRIRFTVFGDAISPGEDIVEPALDNRNSMIYSYARDFGYKNKDVVRKVFEAIFLEGTIKLRFAAKYSFDLVSGVEGLSGGDYGEYDTYMPNPHIFYHACTGSFDYLFTDILNCGNHLAMFDQCIVSGMSLNFGDSTVMKEFLRQLFRDDFKCLQLPDGSITGFSEAVKLFE